MESDHTIFVIVPSDQYIECYVLHINRPCSRNNNELCHLRTVDNQYILQEQTECSRRTRHTVIIYFIYIYILSITKIFQTMYKLQSVHKSAEKASKR